MAKITPEKLLKTLKNIQAHLNNKQPLEGIVQVDADSKSKAEAALRKMIEIVDG